MTKVHHLDARSLKKGSTRHEVVHVWNIFSFRDLVDMLRRGV